jgi:hypothetical protein
MFFIVLPCGYTNLMGACKIERKHNKVNKIIILGAKQMLFFPNLFTYYEHDMAKLVILLDYYNNVYGHYEKGRL